MRQHHNSTRRGHQTNCIVSCGLHVRRQQRCVQFDATVFPEKWNDFFLKTNWNSIEIALDLEVFRSERDSLWSIRVWSLFARVQNGTLAPLRHRFVGPGIEQPNVCTFCSADWRAHGEALLAIRCLRGVAVALNRMRAALRLSVVCFGHGSIAIWSLSPAVRNPGYSTCTTESWCWANAGRPMFPHVPFQFRTVDDTFRRKWCPTNTNRPFGCTLTSMLCPSIRAQRTMRCQLCPWANFRFRCDCHAINCSSPDTVEGQGSWWWLVRNRRSSLDHVNPGKCSLASDRDGSCLANGCGPNLRWSHGTGATFVRGCCISCYQLPSWKWIGYFFQWEFVEWESKMVSPQRALLTKLHLNVHDLYVVSGRFGIRSVAASTI